MAITLDSVMGVLRAIRFPGQDRDLIAAGRVHNLKLENGGVSLRVTLPAAAARAKEQVEQQIREELGRKGAGSVNLTVEVEAGRQAHGHASGQGAAAEKHGVPGVKHIIAVSSGKGGVGKSTVAVNLATSLAKLGHAVGLLDSDVYGPNIPTMMGVDQPPEARMDEVRGELIIPIEAYGVKVMSMGFLARGDQPLVWRGPMLHSVVSQFLHKVDWGTLDYLVVDMPPGTGDVQLSLTQLVPVSGAVLVTTPQEVSLQDVRKAVLMFEKVGVPILGIVENMSYFICDSCSKQHHIFGSEGGRALAEKYRTKLLAQLPLAQAVREAGDAGAPIVVRDPSSVQGKAFLDLGKTVVEEIKASASRPEAQSPEIGEF